MRSSCRITQRTRETSFSHLPFVPFSSRVTPSSFFLSFGRKSRAAKRILSRYAAIFARVYFCPPFFPSFFYTLISWSENIAYHFPRGKLDETNDLRIVLFRGEEIDRKLTDVIDDEEAIIKRIFAAAVANGDKNQRR